MHDTFKEELSLEIFEQYVSDYPEDNTVDENLLLMIENDVVGFTFYTPFYDWDMEDLAQHISSMVDAVTFTVGMYLEGEASYEDDIYYMIARDSEKDGELEYLTDDDGSIQVFTEQEACELMNIDDLTEAAMNGVYVEEVEMSEEMDEDEQSEVVGQEGS